MEKRKKRGNMEELLFLTRYIRWWLIERFDSDNHLRVGARVVVPSPHVRHKCALCSSDRTAKMCQLSIAYVGYLLLDVFPLLPLLHVPSVSSVLRV